MFHTPAHKQPASLVASRALIAELVDHDAPQPKFKVETLRRVHTVRVYYTASPHADSPLAPHPEVQEFTDPAEAQRWAIAQMKWEATVGVVCDQLGFRVEGDLVGVSINKELFAQVPQLKSHH